MSIPLFVLAIVYLVLVAVVGIFGILKSVALFAYGGSFAGFLATALFWGGFALTLVATVAAVGGVDWTTPLLDLSGFFSAPL